MFNIRRRIISMACAAVMAASMAAPTIQAADTSASEPVRTTVAQSVAKRGASAVTAPGKVTMKSTYTSTESSIKVSWNRVTGAAGYKVYAYISGSWRLKKTVTSGSTLSATLTGLNAGTDYSIKVRAYKGTSSKPTYGKYSAVLKTGTKSKQVTGFKVSSRTATTAVLTWNTVRGNGYEISSSTDGGRTYENKITISSSSANTDYVTNIYNHNNNLYDTVNCKFRIRSYNKDASGKKVYSAYTYLNFNKDTTVDNSVTWGYDRQIGKTLVYVSLTFKNPISNGKIYCEGYDTNGRYLGSCYLGTYSNANKYSQKSFSTYFNENNIGSVFAYVVK